MGGLEIVNDRFVELAKERGFYAEELMSDLCDRTTIQNVAAVPDDVKPLFHGPRRARRRPPSYPGGVPGARRQRGEQNDKPAPIGVRRGRKDVFLTARELEVKGITVFRSGAKSSEVLGETPRKEECAGECDYVAVDGGLPDPR